jgi:hypothetical protein
VKNVFDVMRTKEQEIVRVRKELDALRIVARLLAEDGEAIGESKSRLLSMPDSDELLDLKISDQPTA